MLKKSSARDVALQVLERTGQSASVQTLLDEALSGSEQTQNPEQALLSSQDAALASELVYGYLRSEIRLSWLLGRFLKAPEKLPSTMHVILGLAAYELLHLSRIPAHASVHCAVDMVRSRFGDALARVANGVLRSLIRLLPESLPPCKVPTSESGLGRWNAPAIDALNQLYAEIPNPLQRLAVSASLPLWIVRLWHDAYGLDRTRLLAEASSCIPWPCVRINARHPEAGQLFDTLKASAQGIEGTIQTVGDWGLSFAPGTQPKGLRDLQRQGLLSFQGIGSQRVLQALQAGAWPHPIWDACAGRGGKTCLLLEQGVPVCAASDTHWARLHDLLKETTRLGLVCPPLFIGSAAQPPVSFVQAHPAQIARTIVLDVPCSGLGTLARHPDLRVLRSPSHLPPLVNLQARILRAAWDVLPPQGQIAYLTCTVNPAENEEQVTAFMADHPQAQRVCQYQSQPDHTGADLMFGALLRKASA